MMAEEILSKLDILPLSGLLGHEQTIARNESHLYEAMLNIGRLVDPLIVDKKDHVVLDGNHRLSVLRTLHCLNAVCQVVDYSDPTIEVGGWYPSAQKIPNKIDSLKFEDVDFEVGVKALEKKDAYFMAVHQVSGKKKCRLYPSFGKSISTVVLEQQEFLKNVGIEDNFNYVEDTKAQEVLDAGRFVLYRKIFTKHEIVERAKTKVPFPPKSTRHLIPDRIIRLNVPLGWLAEDNTDDAKGKLESMVRQRAADFSIRRYTEPVLVIY